MVEAPLHKVVLFLTPGLMPNVVHPGLTFLINNVQICQSLRYIP